MNGGNGGERRTGLGDGRSSRSAEPLGRRHATAETLTGNGPEGEAGPRGVKGRGRPPARLRGAAAEARPAVGARSCRRGRAGRWQVRRDGCGPWDRRTARCVPPRRSRRRHSTVGRVRKGDWDQSRFSLVQSTWTAAAMTMPQTVQSDICPACGFELDFKPWDEDSASDEICPCCGIQFGYNDAAGRDPAARVPIYENWRAKWVASGMQWWSRGEKPPGNWDPHAQLACIAQFKSR